MPTLDLTDRELEMLERGIRALAYKTREDAKRITAAIWLRDSQIESAEKMERLTAKVERARKD